ncbi:MULTISPECIES: ChaN family lipoprotein [unclassified Beijerinckia]|uniref:ChaN family lipoprotein n=1 Tax=unclassified Beijerinckia TaxID=2638183 RepID=UPI0008987286|nr:MULTISPECIES: ChaN family lipoprotein [unclassified Beijerinckia]MDH7794977.1 putative iron-regulated protein [Beijerinckia sp. GAS462]SEB82639.1 Uncharacterized iron-regulated protein [Beijerinckia sp. 28-YEA-48]
MVEPRRIPHRRACWIDPQTGAEQMQSDLIARMATQQVVLLGETHDIAEIHRWQLQVMTCLHLLRPNMVVGFEMFPRRVQPVLDAWVAQELTTADFIERSEWATVWGFDPAIYLPLFYFCRQQNVPMKALNCTRSLVTRVGQLGWDVIPLEERDSVTPSAPATQAYRDYLTGLMAGVAAPFAAPERFDRFIRAQQVWDRSFACAIADCLKGQADDPLVIGIIGRGHLEYGHGTPYQLHDLGVSRIGVLLPTDRDSHDADVLPGIADGLFRLAYPEPPAERRPVALKATP